MSLGSMNWKSIKSWIYFYFIDIQMKDNRIENVIMLIVFIFWREKKIQEQKLLQKILVYYLNLSWFSSDKSCLL